MQTKFMREKEDLKQQFRDITASKSKGKGSTVSKKDLVGDPRYRSVKNVDDIKTLKKEDMERVREKTRRIQCMVRDCTRQRKIIVDMQKQIATVDGSQRRRMEAAEQERL